MEKNVNEVKHTPAQLRELRAIERTGEVSDLAEFGASHLAFHARDRVLGALLRRELIRDEPGGYVVTEAGRAAIAKATGSTTPNQP
jgi:hypothetical protein